jgi:hypothetical protein
LKRRIRNAWRNWKDSPPSPFEELSRDAFWTYSEAYDLIRSTYNKALENHLPLSELTEKYEKIAAGAKKLACAIKNKHIKIDDDYVETFNWKKLFWAITFCCPPTDPRRQQILDLLRSAILDHESLENEAEFSLEKFSFEMGGTPYHEVLETLQEDAEKRVKWLKGKLSYDFHENEAEDRGSNDELWDLMANFPLIRAPNAANATANYFIRDLCLFFLNLFGSPHYRLLAIVASVALEPHLEQGAVIGDETARSTLKQYKKLLEAKFGKKLMTKFLEYMAHA